MSRVRKPDVKGRFSMKSFYNALADSSGGVEGWHNFWTPTVPPRVLVFCWIARLNKILTIDKLRRRCHIIINGCPMCLEDEETVHHLLIHCPFAHRVWSTLFEMFGME